MVLAATEVMIPELVYINTILVQIDAFAGSLLKESIHAGSHVSLRKAHELQHHSHKMAAA
jgi:hypothetical protein